MPSLQAALAIIPSLPRPVLDRLTQRMVDRLDEMDGDCDREPEDDRFEAADDGLAPFDRHGIRFWGSDQEATDRLPAPRYGIDQTAAILNR